MKHLLIASLLAIVALSACTAKDQPPADKGHDLDELIGSRAIVIDTLADRGYTHHHTEKSGSSSFTYWVKDDSGECFSVETTNGKVAAIAQATDKCVDQVVPVAEGFYETICGVIRDSEVFSYRCQAGDMPVDGQDATVLRLPDNEVTFKWVDDKNVVIERQGMVPEDATYSVSEGETDVFTSDMTYFYYSDRGRAESELSHFTD